MTKSIRYALRQTLPVLFGYFLGLCVRHLAGTGGLYLGVGARHQPHRLCRVYAVRTREPAVLRRIAFGRSHHDHRYQQPAHVLWPELSFPLPGDGRAHGAAFARRLYANRLFHDGAICRVVHRAIQSADTPSACAFGAVLCARLPVCVRGEPFHRPSAVPVAAQHAAAHQRGDSRLYAPAPPILPMCGHEKSSALALLFSCFLLLQNPL